MFHSDRRFYRSTLCSILMLLIIVILFAGCGDDPVPEPNCLPVKAAVAFSGQYYFYEYNDAGKLTEFTRRSGEVFIAERYAVEYSGDRVSALQIMLPLGETEVPGPVYKIIYGSDNKPKEVQYFTDKSAPDPVNTLKFTHDNSGRISKREFFTYTASMGYNRYEYNDDNNVSKVFHKQIIGDDEVLGSEYLSFDDKKRFFAGSPELTLLELYVFNYEPSVNNVLTEKIHATRNETYTPAGNITYSLSYDEKGNVSRLTSTAFQPIATLIFQKMDYECK